MKSENKYEKVNKLTTKIIETNIKFIVIIHSFNKINDCLFICLFIVLFEICIEIFAFISFILINNSF